MLEVSHIIMLYNGASRLMGIHLKFVQLGIKVPNRTFDVLVDMRLFQRNGSRVSSKNLPNRKVSQIVERSRSKHPRTAK